MVYVAPTDPTGHGSPATVDDIGQVDETDETNNARVQDPVVC
jgi:hypothetical protein